MRNARRLPVVAAAVVALVGLGACTSTPSEKAVAKDVVVSIGLEPDQETCMIDAIDEYTEGQVEAIGEASESVDFSQPDAVEDSGIPELQDWVADLNRCMAAG